MTPPTRVLLLMGVSGSGKTTVGRALAEDLGWVFEDADDYHDAGAREKMARGEGLTDDERAPWLERLAALVRACLRSGPPTVIACSALRAAYRDRLSVADPCVRVVWLSVPASVLADRLSTRAGHYAGPDLLASQLDTLEPPTRVLRLDGTAPVEGLVETVRSAIGAA